MATENQDLNNAPDPRDLYVDERTEKKIEKHLTDETDEITEEDIANAPAGLVNKSTEDQLEKEKPAKTDVEPVSREEQVKDNEDPSIETPWNILES